MANASAGTSVIAANRNNHLRRRLRCRGGAAPGPVVADAGAWLPPSFVVADIAGPSDNKRTEFPIAWPCRRSRVRQNAGSLPLPRVLANAATGSKREVLSPHGR